MSFLRKAALVNSAELLCLGLGVIQTIVLGRVLGPAGVGQYHVIRSALMLTAQLCCLGFPLSFLYHSQHDPENTKKYLMNTIWSMLFLGAVAGGVVVLLVLSKTDYFGLLPRFALVGVGLYVPILLSQLIARNTLLIRIEARRLSVIRVLSVAGGLAMILVFYTAGMLRVPQALLGLVLAALTGSLAGWIWAGKYLDASQKPSWKTIRRLGSMGIRLGWADLMILVNAQVNILIVKYLLTGFEDVGYFSRALVIAMLAVVAGQAVLPLLFSQWASFPEQRIPAHVEKVMRFASTISIIMIFGILFFGRWMVLLLWGARFLPAVVPMMILVPGAVLYLLSRTLMMLLGSRGAPELSSLSLLAGIIVNVVLSFLLIPQIGISGAAWASTWSNIVLLLLLAFIVKKKYKVRFAHCFGLNRSDMASIMKELRSKAGTDSPPQA